ncbi:hypothetical protein TruAng_002671 [Truncatella angustata]|nr:hypothetical protein TruAng_002671 [Truncatella angustata]
MNQDQLALGVGGCNGHANGQRSKNVRSAEDKAILMEQWDEFPLRSANDLRRWAQTCRAPSNPSSFMPIDTTAGADHEPSDHEEASLLPTSVENIPVGQHRLTLTHTAFSQDELTHDSGGSYEIQLERMSAAPSDMRGNCLGDSEAPTTNIDTPDPRRDTCQIRDVPQQFRQQFLW